MRARLVDSGPSRGGVWGFPEAERSWAGSLGTNVTLQVLPAAPGGRMRRCACKLGCLNTNELVREKSQW